MNGETSVGKNKTDRMSIIRKYRTGEQGIQKTIKELASFEKITQAKARYYINDCVAYCGFLSTSKEKES
jgi:Fic family protein